MGLKVDHHIWSLFLSNKASLPGAGVGAGFGPAVTPAQFEAADGVSSSPLGQSFTPSPIQAHGVHAPFDGHLK